MTWTGGSLNYADALASSRPFEKTIEDFGIVAANCSFGTVTGWDDGSDGPIIARLDRAHDDVPLTKKAARRPGSKKQRRHR